MKLPRGLRKTRQDVRRAAPRSTGARADRARSVGGLISGGSSCRGLRLLPLAPLTRPFGKRSQSQPEAVFHHAGQCGSGGVVNLRCHRPPLATGGSPVQAASQEFVRTPRPTVAEGTGAVAAMTTRCPPTAKRPCGFRRPVCAKCEANGWPDAVICRPVDRCEGMCDRRARHPNRAGCCLYARFASRPPSCATGGLPQPRRDM